MPNSLEQFEAKYGKRGDGSLSYAGWDFRWEAWQAGAAAERQKINAEHASKVPHAEMEKLQSAVKVLRDRSAP